MTTTFALTDNHYSLEKAAVDFGCTLHKTHPATHGVVTEEYIDYNVNDVLLTHELYTRVMDRYKMYCLDKPLDKLYSPASLGKAYLEKIGVKPFMDLNI
jgi:hypothetical protein